MAQQGGLMETQRFCVWCGGRVAKNALRNYCAAHLRLASYFDQCVETHIMSDDWPDPQSSVPLYREPDPN